MWPSAPATRCLWCLSYGLEAVELAAARWADCDDAFGKAWLPNIAAASVDTSL